MADIENVSIQALFAW